MGVTVIFFFGRALGVAEGNVKQPRIQRNEIYARYGRAFSSADLKAHFGKQSWYSERADSEERGVGSVASTTRAFALPKMARARSEAAAATSWHMHLIMERSMSRFASAPFTWKWYRRFYEQVLILTWCHRSTKAHLCTWLVSKDIQK